MTLDFWRCIKCSAIAVSLLYTTAVYADWNPDQSSETKTSAASPEKKLSPFALDPVLFEKSPSPFLPPLEKKDPEIKVPADQQTAEDLCKKGTNFAVEGKYEKARIALAQSLEIDPRISLL